MPEQAAGVVSSRTTKVAPSMSSLFECTNCGYRPNCEEVIRPDHEGDCPRCGGAIISYAIDTAKALRELDYLRALVGGIDFEASVVIAKNVKLRCRTSAEAVELLKKLVAMRTNRKDKDDVNDLPGWLRNPTGSYSVRDAFNTAADRIERAQTEVDCLNSTLVRIKHFATGSCDMSPKTRLRLIAAECHAQETVSAVAKDAVSQTPL